jgi:hypothetical protein
MKQEKLFTVAGTSNRKGEVKVRFANDLVARIKALHRFGHTEVDLVELPRPMTKLEALIHLQSIGYVKGDAQYAVAAKIAEKSKAANKGEITIKGTIPVVKTESSVETV